MHHFPSARTDQPLRPDAQLEEAGPIMLRPPESWCSLLSSPADDQSRLYHPSRVPLTLDRPPLRLSQDDVLVKSCLFCINLKVWTTIVIVASSVSRPSLTALPAHQQWSIAAPIGQTKLSTLSFIAVSTRVKTAAVPNQGDSPRCDVFHRCIVLELSRMVSERSQTTS